MFPRREINICGAGVGFPQGTHHFWAFMGGPQIYTRQRVLGDDFGKKGGLHISWGGGSPKRDTPIKPVWALGATKNFPGRLRFGGDKKPRFLKSQKGSQKSPGVKKHPNLVWAKNLAKRGPPLWLLGGHKRGGANFLGRGEHPKGGSIYLGAGNSPVIKKKRFPRLGPQEGRKNPGRGPGVYTRNRGRDKRPL